MILPALVTLLWAGATAAAEDCVPVGQVLLPATEKFITTPALIQSHKDQKVILLGEHHDNMEHHRWQLQMISGLHAINPNLVLGFEMFPRKSQPVLDRWVRGELSEEAFLKEVGWNDFWSFDAQLYLPLFHYARMNRIPVYALNVERSLIRAVGKNGWQDIPAEQKEGVSAPAAASDGYRQMLATVFMQHGEDHSGSADELVAKAMKTPGFDRFVESQQVWDRAMAEAIAGGLKQHPGAQFVAVMGSGHMMYKFGVPEQLAALGIEASSALIPWDPEFECEYIQKDFADAVIGLQAIRFSEQQKNDARPKLGVYLDRSERGVLITKVTPDSIAATLGLQENDVIVEMAGMAVSDVEQVIELVKATQFGTWLPMAVKRGDEKLSFVAKFPAKGAHPQQADE